LRGAIRRRERFRPRVTRAIECRDRSPVQSRRMNAGDVVDGRFEVERLVGEGGMGAVYRCRDRTTGEPLALKVLKETAPEDRARFDREARLLAGLDHPRIVKSIAHGETTDGQPFI